MRTQRPRKCKEAVSGPAPTSEQVGSSHAGPPSVRDVFTCALPPDTQLPRGVPPASPYTPTTSHRTASCPVGGSQSVIRSLAGTRTSRARFRLTAFLYSERAGRASPCSWSRWRDVACVGLWVGAPPGGRGPQSSLACFGPLTSPSRRPGSPSL